VSVRRARARKTRAPSIAILGAGAVAAAFARSLADAGVRVHLWARSGARARAVAKAAGRRVATVSSLLELADERVVLLCVSDAGIPDLARRLATALPAGRGRVALHTSGYLDMCALESLARAGWSTGSLHPLLALPAGKKNASLDGAFFAVEGSLAARREGARLARALHGEILALGSAAKPGYHAGAALLGGGLVVLLDVAERMLARALGEPVLARRALASLARSVLDNVAELGPARALTGPAARGDAERIAGHLRELRALSPEDATLYRTLVRRMLVLARSRGALGPAERRRVERAVSPRPGR
jgi:predicted short-subunit dehydrogenase-like oxidoreductase (DUF2520 family)